MVYLKQLAILILMFSVFACTSEEDLLPEDEIDVPQRNEDNQDGQDGQDDQDGGTVSKATIEGSSFLAFADDFQIETEGDWSIMGMEDWMELSAESGQGNATIDITVDKNGSFENREAMLKIITGEDEAELKVIQPGIDLSSDMTILQEGQYIHFPENNSIMKVPSDPAFNFAEGQSFSISYKIRTNVEPAEDSRVIARRAGFGVGFELLLKSTKGNLTTGSMNFTAVDADGPKGSYWSTSSVVDGTWHHIVGVYDVQRGKGLLYVDGVLESSINRDNMGAITTDEPLYFGAKNDGFGFPYVGDLDDVRFWNKALSVEEIYADAANVVLDSNKDKLISAWGFETVDEEGVHDDDHNFTGELKNGATIK